MCGGVEIKKAEEFGVILIFFFPFQRKRPVLPVVNSVTIPASRGGERSLPVASGAGRQVGVAPRADLGHFCVGPVPKGSEIKRGAPAGPWHSGDLLLPGCIAKLPLLLPGLRLPAPCGEARPRDGLGRAFLQPGCI